MLLYFHWLYFRMLYCTGAKLTFIGGLCGTEPIRSVVMLVSKYGGRKFLGMQLCLAPAQDPTQIFDCGDYWCFLTSSSCFSHRPTDLHWTRVQPDNIRRKATWLSWLKYLQALGLALFGLNGLTQLTSFEHVSSQTTYTVRLLDCLG